MASPAPVANEAYLFTRPHPGTLAQRAAYMTENVFIAVVGSDDKISLHYVRSTSPIPYYSTFYRGPHVRSGRRDKVRAKMLTAFGSSICSVEERGADRPGSCREHLANGCG